MAHPADFPDAQDRHWNDAELLRDNGRWANADQLYGFSAECGLKAVMKALGMAVDPSTGAPTEKKYWKHVQKLWPEFTGFVDNRDGARYLSLLPGGTPFADWSTDDRYANSGHFEEANVNLHRQAASAIRGMVQKLRRDGRP